MTEAELTALANAAAKLHYADVELQRAKRVYQALLIKMIYEDPTKTIDDEDAAFVRACRPRIAQLFKKIDP